MCKAPGTKSIGGGGPSLLDFLVGAALLAYTVGFLAFRGGELVPLVAFYVPHCTAALVGTLVLRRALGRRARWVLHIASLTALVYVMDYVATKPLPEPSAVHSSLTVAITGANAGVGYETARQLAVNYGVQVIMGCRSQAKCSKAADAIAEEIAIAQSSGSVMPMLIDLSDLQSVKSFVPNLEGRTVDVLFNNAGYVPGAGAQTNQYGLDPSFTSMHLAHFFLAEELLKLNPELRVVNTSSGTHHLCALPFVLPRFALDRMHLPQRPGCLDEEYLTTGIRSETDGSAYIQSKLANVMHAVELPRRHPQATAVAIDLGWVGTTIQPFMEGALTPTNLGWMRSASVGVVPMLHAILSTKEDLLEGLGEERKLNDFGVIQNVFGRTEEAFSYPWWRDGPNNLSRERMIAVGEKLWEESASLLQENGY